MAKFEMELPADLLRTFKVLGSNAQKILGEMTQAGAEVVYVNMYANAPDSFRGSDIMKCLHITRVYNTPSDDGINTKVAFYGYFKPRHSPGPKWIAERGTDKMAAELVVNVFEHGRSSLSFPKHPFVRKSFNKRQIEAAMLKVQRKYIPEE